ncbi:MAG: beta-galactosidase [Victivallales bacterium]
MKTSAVMAACACMALAISGRPLNAEETDLTPQSVMRANSDARGYAFEEPYAYAGPIPELIDNKDATNLLNPTPYQYPWITEAWFPSESPVMISHVTARTGTRAVTRWTMQVWQGDADGSWKTVASCVGDAKPIDASFEPLKVRGVRLLIEDSKGSAWGELSLNEFHVFGPQQELALLPSAKSALLLSTKREMNIFPAGTPMEVTAKIMNTDAASAHEFTIQSEWLDYYLEPVAPSETRTVSLKGGTAADFSFSYAPPEQGAFFCRVSLRLRGALANQTLILCGSRDPDILSHVKPFRCRKPLGEASPEALVGEGRILWSTEMYHQSSIPHFLPGPAHFRELRKAGGNIICTMPTWAAVEPLPGVYNFKYYDHCLRLAEEYGLRVEFGLWNYNFGREHKWWLMDEYVRDADGKVGTGVNRMFSLAGPKNRAGILQTVEVLLKRYKDNPWIGIWQFKIYGHVDWMFPGGYTEFDYSEPYRREFCRWLTEEKGLSIDALAARHGTAYKSWDEVKIGAPIWWGGAQDKDYSAYLELRPLQQDSYDFRDWIMSKSCREVYDLIRRHDSTRMIGNWLQPYLARGQIELTDQYMIPGGNNGGETIELIRQCLDMESPGKWARIEPWGPMNAHFGKLKAFNWLLFNCGSVHTKQVNYVFPVWEDNPCWEQFSRPATKQLLTDLSDAARPRSRILGLHSYATNHREGRATQSYIELDRWFRMLSYSSWMVKPGNWMQWQLSDGTLSNLEDYDLIIDDHSRVITAENVERLARWTEKGGTLVIFSNSGEAILGETRKSWPLLTRLGYTVEASEMEKIGKHSKFLFAPGNPVFTDMKTEIAVQGYPVLNPPKGAQVLAMIDDKPGAILWSVGKGRVVLIAGKIGDYDLGEIWGAIDKKDKDGKGVFYPMRNEATVRVEESLSPFLDALVRWSGVKTNQPLKWDTANSALLGYYKRDRDVHYVVFLNRGKEAVDPVFSLGGLPEGNYALHRITADENRALGHRTAAEIAARVGIGALEPDRMAAVRIELLP